MEATTIQYSNNSISRGEKTEEKLQTAAKENVCQRRIELKCRMVEVNATERENGVLHSQRSTRNLKEINTSVYKFIL